MKNREILEIVKGTKTQDGAGVKLTRVLSKDTIYSFDPFLMLDSFDAHNPEDYTLGFPWHPHRGIETVTYLIDGEIEHSDSLQNKGVIHAGGCQWMTAGGGIMHQEMPQASEHMLGFQLWLNMPQANKMSSPAYNDIIIGNENILHENGATIRVISGNYDNKVFGFSPLYVDATILDVSLEKDCSIMLNCNPENTVFIFSIVDEVIISAQTIPEKSAVLLGNGDCITIQGVSSLSRFIYFEAKPLKEPVAWGGPIVMNTREELQAAFEDLQNGTFIR